MVFVCQSCLDRAPAKVQAYCESNATEGPVCVVCMGISQPELWRAAIEAAMAPSLQRVRNERQELAVSVQLPLGAIRVAEAALGAAAERAERAGEAGAPGGVDTKEALQAWPVDFKGAVRGTDACYARRGRRSLTLSLLASLSMAAWHSPIQSTLPGSPSKPLSDCSHYATSFPAAITPAVARLLFYLSLSLCLSFYLSLFAYLSIFLSLSTSATVLMPSPFAARSSRHWSGSWWARERGRSWHWSIMRS